MARFPRTGISGSASFHREKQSWQAAFALTGATALVWPATLRLYLADDATELCAFFGCSANELAAGADGGLRARALTDLFRNGAVLGDPSRCSFRGSHQVIWLTHVRISSVAYERVNTLLV